MKTTRRNFIKNTSYVAIGFSLVPNLAWISVNEQSSQGVTQQSRITDWLQILDDGRVRVFSGKMELGQGIRIAIAQVAAEELNMNVDFIEVKLAETSTTPNEGYTAGSQSVARSAMSVRKAAAAAAAILIARTAEKYEIKAENLYLKDGMVLSKDGDFRASFFNILDGVQIEEVVPENIQTKSKEDYEVVGTPVARKDIGEMVRGLPMYVQDLRFPGMLYARVVRAAAYDAKLTEFNKENAEKLDVKIIKVKDFIGVISEDEYQAEKAKIFLERDCKWDTETELPVEEFSAEYLKNLSKETENVVNKGNVAFKNNSISAKYFKPYVMHAAVGPSCAIAIFKEEKLEIWSHTQGVYPLRKTLADLLNLNEENIKITGVPGSGCYGHNAADDVAAEAAILAVENPEKYIKLQWTRADEHAWEPYGSAMVMEMEGSLGTNGKIENWKYNVWSDTHSTRPGGDKQNLLPSSFYNGTTAKRPKGYFGGAYRNSEPYYKIPNQKIDAHYFKGPLRVSALRSLGAYSNILAIENFMDRLADKAGEDPVAFRLKHLEDQRAKDVLKKVKEMTLGVELLESEGLGFAFSRYKNSASYFAVAAKVSVENAKVSVKEMWGAIDSGEIINPDGLKNQTEGGMIQSASWTLQEAVKFDQTHVSSTNWESYPIFRFADIPFVHVEVIDRPDEDALGAGEAAQGPSAAAILNAVYRATGKQVAFLPVNKNVSV
ncbi:molybdopterin-dependent oxidoreductase [Salegentibacter sp. JZCK2]|uniref:xanthine dehydrogenase family protein molybdopterin-binding subunit n=1 Tax=Salegentibacter tibetensis TaxID=2873600 RepID=UPI001CCF806F|nr:molybdopterin cofactor-binding domain-containing protein [Salegentibacter tibetensis]MBZ9731499.1 molybdopterin-dependent oxidoreductase [Salegentibacter tibetensis]